MIYNKINNENTNDYPQELKLGLEALNALLPTLKEIEGNEIIKVNSWLRIILQDGKKDIAKVDSEVHVKHHDIFYLSEGRELSIYQGNYTSYDEALAVFGNPVAHDTGFKDEKDIGFVALAPTKESVWNVLENDYFVHYEPSDYHASQIAMDKNPVKKIVVKILDKKYWENDMSENTLQKDIAEIKETINKK